VPLYECSMEAAKSQIATFMKTFPNGTVWGNTLKGGGYDLALMARKGDASIDLAQLQARLDRQDHLNVKYSLGEVDIQSAVDVASLYSGRGSDLGPWMADAEINEDRNLKLQYLAGVALNLYEQDAIYRAILSYRRFPEDLFIGSEELKQAVRANVIRGQ